MKYLTIILLITTAFSCQEAPRKKEKITTEVIDVLSYENKMTADLSGLYDSLTFIPFKVESPIGSIEKLIVQKGKIYVWDEDAEKVWGFNSEGDSLFCIDKQGKGPDEYLRISDVSVNDLGYINILDASRKSILEYNLKGEMTERKQFKDWIHGYWEVDGYEYAFTNTPDLESEGHYLKVMKNSEKLRSYFPASHIWRYNGTTFTPSGDSVFYTRRLDDCIYYFKEGVMRKAYTVDFGVDSTYKKKLREADNLDEYKNLFEEQQYIGDIWDLCVTDTHLAFMYSRPVEEFSGRLRANFFYNRNTKEGLSFNTRGHSNSDHYKVGSPLASDGHYFYALVNPWDLNDEQRERLEETMGYPIGENLNIVLCRFLIKI